MSENDIEVKQLIEELERLQLQITRVNEHLRQIDNTTHSQSDVNQAKTKSALSVGDTVEVTNKYKGRLGVQGTVIKKTSAQVLI
jgi:septation ring formation regulator EzrA